MLSAVCPSGWQLVLENSPCFKSRTWQFATLCREMLNHLCKDIRRSARLRGHYRPNCRPKLVLSLPVGLTAAIVLEEERAQATGHQLFLPVSKESLGSNDHSSPSHFSTRLHCFVLGRPFGRFRTREHKDQMMRQCGLTSLDRCQTCQQGKQSIAWSAVNVV